MFVLPDLPYAYDALSPVISERTMRIHHDRHHAAYVNTLNQLLGQDSPATLEEVVRAQAGKGGKPFNNAAQAWNHAFFWVSMAPGGGSRPDGEIARAVDAAFGGLPGLKDAFVASGVGQFGSGWVWLVADAGGRLQVLATHDAETPLTRDGLTPLLVCDVWEHAYYLDHQNDRKGFLEAWFDGLADWRFAATQYAAARSGAGAWRYPAGAAQPA